MYGQIFYRSVAEYILSIKLKNKTLLFSTVLVQKGVIIRMNLNMLSNDMKCEIYSQKNDILIKSAD